MGTAPSDDSDDNIFKENGIVGSIVLPSDTIGDFSVQKSLPKMRKVDLGTDLNISLEGLGLPEEQTKRVESEIRGRLKREVENYQTYKLQPTKKIAPKDQNEMIISLRGLGLPEEQTRRVESEIREMLEKELNNYLLNPIKE